MWLRVSIAGLDFGVFVKEIKNRLGVNGVGPSERSREGSMRAILATRVCEPQHPYPS